MNRIEVLRASQQHNISFTQYHSEGQAQQSLLLRTGHYLPSFLLPWWVSCLDELLQKTIMQCDGISYHLRQVWSCFWKGTDSYFVAVVAKWKPGHQIIFTYIVIGHMSDSKDQSYGGKTCQFLSVVWYGWLNSQKFPFCLNISADRVIKIDMGTKIFYSYNLLFWGKWIKSIQVTLFLI